MRRSEVVFPPKIFLEKENKTLSKIIAIAGGLTRRVEIQKIQITRCSIDFSPVENINFIDFKEIKKGVISDQKLNGGEIIFVPKKNSRSTIDKALLTPTLVSETQN